MLCVGFPFYHPGGIRSQVSPFRAEIGSPFKVEILWSLLNVLMCHFQVLSFRNRIDELQKQ